MVRRADPAGVLAPAARRIALLRAAAGAARYCAPGDRGCRSVHPHPLRHAPRGRAVFDWRQLRARDEAVPERVRIRVGAVLLRYHERSEREADLPARDDVRRRRADPARKRPLRNCRRSGCDDDHIAVPPGGARRAVGGSRRGAAGDLSADVDRPEHHEEYSVLPGRHVGGRRHEHRPQRAPDPAAGDHGRGLRERRRVCHAGGDCVPAVAALLPGSL